MKKITYFVFIFLCILSFFLLYSNKLLNAAEPTEISNCVELQAMKDNLSGDYVLVNDIDCTFDTQDPDGALYNEGAGFEPIGNSTNRFTGSFDGNGYVISELYINRPSTTGVGLFSHVDGANINNVGLVDVNVTGNNSVSGFVGWTANSTISNSYSTGFITGVGWAGGLVGYSWDSLIEGSYSWSDVNGSSNIGGLVGEAESSTISNSYSTGSVTGSGDFVGGLVGRAGEGNITNSYAIGSVSGIGGSGGLVGGNFGDITDSYATGTVSGDEGTGGLVGGNFGDITNSYATGSVIGIDAAGGLVGVHEDGSISNSFWYKSTENSELDCYYEGNTGCTAIFDLTYFFNYDNPPMSMSGDGWDFEEVWSDRYNGENHAVLGWQVSIEEEVVDDEMVDDEVVDEEVVDEKVVDEEVVEEKVVEEEAVEAAADEEEVEGEDKNLQNTVINEELAKTGIGILPIFFSALSILTGTLFLNRYKRFF